MSIIALLTDFGLIDTYVGIVKAVILNINPKAEIVDITHQVLRGNINQGAFLLLKSFKFFPKCTIFLGIVDPGVGSSRYPIAIKTKNYYFVGPDNGILSLAAKEDGIEKIVVLENKKYFLKNISSTFHGRDIFAPSCAYISKGQPIENFGREIKKIKEVKIPLPKITKNTLYAQILYGDIFGNLITNLEKEVLLKFSKNKNFIATLGGKKITKIYNFYKEAKDEELFFIEGSFGLLEISCKNKSAADFLKIKNENFFKNIVKIKCF
ncbi:MAG: SAM-dependent chlorinase/fluorinase [Candidatus Omnitrophica bacterium]|nr:SAM-dependent chlorinase/fluorinase [Candidatus Omnitrophota bacterium]